MATSTFLLGSHLCREPMPAMSELKGDMENLRARGFNLVKLQEHWMVDEPQEGAYDFSRYEELIDHAGKLDMQVYLGLTCEQAPHWLWEKHPECRMECRDGRPMAVEAQRTLPADGKPGPCFDHPGARADMCRFITRLVEVLGRHDNLAYWNTWQEVGYWGETYGGGHVCYCPNTIAHWQRWLEERFGGLDELNGAWRTRYADWADIQPERSQRMPSAHEISFRTFMDNVQTAEVLRARAEAIRAADPKGRPIFAHLGEPAIGAGQNWTWARCQGFLGCSAYPAWGRSFEAWDDGRPAPGEPFDKYAALFQEMWAAVAVRFDHIRSCNPRGAPVWAAEFQGGPISTGLAKGRVPDEEDIRRWMLTAMASGVTAVCFWVTRAEIMADEINGFSLLDSVGDTTPRLEEAARVGRALQEHADLFGEPTLEPADVAIVVNEANFQMVQCLTQGAGNLAYSVRGWHRLLWEAGVSFDFVEAGQLAEPFVRDFKAMVLPFPLSLSEEVAGDLAAYVAGGGNLISEAACGRIDEYAFANRGELSPGMAGLFGVRQLSFTQVAEPDGELRWTPPPRTWGELLPAALLAGAGPLAGHSLRANVYVETYECTGSQPLLHHGDAVAGTVRQVGKGNAWLLGTFVGHAGTAYRCDETHTAVAEMLKACGVRGHRIGPLLVRKRVAGDREAWLLTNPTGEEVVEHVKLDDYELVADLLGAAVAGTDDDSVTITVPPVNVECLIVRKRKQSPNALPHK